MTEQAESAPILWACDIAKSFGGVHALRGADFTLRRGEIHALIGENGAGKSTLVKIFTGIQAPDHGQVLLDGRTVRLHSPADAARHGIGAVFQELSQLNDLTVAQNIFAGREPRGRFGLLSPARMRMATRTLMDQFGIAGIDPDDLSGDLTLAQRQLVEVLKALSRRPRILILDEATSALPQAEVAHLFTIVRGLRDEGLSVIYISHRLEEIITLADRATVFRDGQHVAVVDPRETGQDQLINLMIGHRLAEMYPPRVVEPLSAVALEGRRLGRGGALHDVDLQVGRGEILGIGGLAGQGQADLMFALCGARPAATGQILLDGCPLHIRNPRDAIRHGIAYVAEDRKGEGVILALSVRQNIVLPTLTKRQRLGLLDLRAERGAVRASMQRLRIKTPSPAQAVGALSGGNQQKVVLAKWLLADVRVLLLHDPTRGIDVGSKREIFDLMRQLAAKGVAIIFVSSDLTEIIGMSDRVAIMYEGTIVQTLGTGEISGDRIIAAAVGVEQQVVAAPATATATAGATGA
jgi:ribose transport system ATP-binding protein